MKQSSLSTSSSRTPLPPDRVAAATSACCGAGLRPARGRSRWLSAASRALPAPESNRRAASRPPDSAPRRRADTVRIRMPVLMSPFSEIMPDGAAIPAARVLFQILDGLRRRLLRRADHGDGPHVRQERVERIEALLRACLPRDPRCGTRRRSIRSGGVRSRAPIRARRRATYRCGRHRCTWSARILLWWNQQLADVIGVAQRIAGAARGARDGAGLHALRPRRARTSRAKRRSIARRRTGAKTRTGWDWPSGCARTVPTALPGVGRAEGLPQHDFVVVAAPHAFADRFDVGRVLFGRVIADDRRRASACRRRGHLSAPCIERQRGDVLRARNRTGSARSAPSCDP